MQFYCKLFKYSSIHQYSVFKKLRSYFCNLVFSKNQEIFSIIEKVKTKVTFLNKSTIAADLFRKESELTLIQSNETRWNSVFFYVIKI